MVNMSFPRRRESRFPSGHYANGKLCRAQKFIMIGIIALPIFPVEAGRSSGKVIL
jgi:hypothetical protein